MSDLHEIVFTDETKGWMQVRFICQSGDPSNDEYMTIDIPHDESDQPLTGQELSDYVDNLFPTHCIGRRTAVSNASESTEINNMVGQSYTVTIPEPVDTVQYSGPVIHAEDLNIITI